jgi:hypothetical protein
MSDEDIIIPEHRRTKNDEKAKRKYWRYKKGGHDRIRLKEDLKAKDLNTH